MTLREGRCEFTRHLAALISWCFEQGYQVALDEGKVISPRKVRKAGVSFKAEDAEHMPGSLHHLGLAADLVLYIDGEWISDGGHPAWARIGLQWERMGREAGVALAWGGRFKSVDSNHFSRSWSGVA